MRKLLAWWAASFLWLHAHMVSSCIAALALCSLCTLGMWQACWVGEKHNVGDPTEESWCFVTDNSPALPFTAAPSLLTLPHLARGTQSNWSFALTWDTCELTAPDCEHSCQLAWSELHRTDKYWLQSHPFSIRAACTVNRTLFQMQWLSVTTGTMTAGVTRREGDF